MCSKRNYCIEKFSQLFQLGIDNHIVLNLEKGIFNETIKYCKNNNYELNWSNKSLCIL